MSAEVDWQSRAAKLEQLVIRLRDKLEWIVDEIEDEGDRVFFGSTNHADELKTIFRELDDIKWVKIIKGAKP